jgi:hypothetical protein
MFSPQSFVRLMEILSPGNKFVEKVVHSCLTVERKFHSSRKYFIPKQIISAINMPLCMEVLFTWRYLWKVCTLLPVEAKESGQYASPEK